MRIFDTAITTELSKEALKPFFMLEFQLSSTMRWNDIDIDIYDALGNKFIPIAFDFGNIVGSSGMSVESIDINIDDTNQAISAILLGEDVRNKTAILYFGVIPAPITKLVYEANWGFDAVLDFDAVTGFDMINWGFDGVLNFNSLANFDGITNVEHPDTGGEWVEYVISQAEIKSQELLRGIIGGWELYDDNKAKVTITSEMVLWNKKSLRPQTSSCPWTFKGTSGECGYAGAETLCDQSYDRCLALANTGNYGGDRFLPAIVTREIFWGRTAGR